MAILTLSNLAYTYQNTKKPTLQNITMNFEEGKIYCIIGKSGSGKTTLLSLLAGLDVCKQGRITFEQEDLKEIDRDLYRSQKIGIIFQGYHLLHNATAVENVVLAMHISNVKGTKKKEDAYALLERVGISRTSADRKILKLSGGEQQRVGIARALSHNPKLILADEPSGNLDEDSENEIMEILYQLAHEQGKCIIIVTHSKNLANYADEVWSMNKKGQLLYIEH